MLPVLACRVPDRYAFTAEIETIAMGNKTSLDNVARYVAHCEVCIP